MGGYTIPRKKQWGICINMNNLKRKANIIDHSIPYRALGCVKHKNDRWRLVNRAMKTRRLYKVTYKEKCIGKYITFIMYEHDLSKQAVYDRWKDEDNMDIIEVVEVE